MKLLSIGRDPSVFDTTSPLYERMQLYATQYDFVHVVMCIGAPREVIFGTSKAISP